MRRSLQVVAVVGLFGFALVILIPLLWMIVSAGKSNVELFGDPWGLPDEYRFSNFVDAWNRGVFRFLGNSVLVTVISVLTVTFISAAAAFGLTRVRIPFNQPILTLILAGLMLSPTVAVIPLFDLMQGLGLYNTHLALIVLYTAFRIPFTTFLIRSYMVSLPHEVDEAARIDGASQWQLFWRIILPQCRPILASAAVLQAMFAWNEFLFATIFLSDSVLMTLPVGLVNMQGMLTRNWPVMFAGLVLAAVPMAILFFASQRHFVRGLSEGVGK